MNVPLDHSGDEVKRLQRCINELASLLAGPALPAAGDRSGIARVLIDALLGMLRLDVVYVRLVDPDGRPSTEMARLARSPRIETDSREIGAALDQSLGEAMPSWPADGRVCIGGTDLVVATARLGLKGELGVVVGGSRRSGFPGEGERLLLSVAADQAALALHDACREELKQELVERQRVEAALRESESHSRMVVESIPAGIALLSPAGEVEVVNSQLVKYFGKPLEELKDWATGDVVHPDDLARVVEAFTHSIATGEPFDNEQRLRRLDGSYRWVQVRWAPLRHADGQTVGWCTLHTDIDERKRAETHLAGQKHVLEMIASGRPLRDVLGAVCRFFEEGSPDCCCGIYPIDWSGPMFRYGVAPSLPASYTDPIAGLPVGCDVAPCGIAAHEKIQVIAEDIESDSRWKGTSYRTHVLEHGLRAVWSTPICSQQGRVLGTFCIYQRTPGVPNAHHQNLIAHATHIASIAIERSQAEAALRRNEMLLAEGQRLSATGTYSWRVETDEFTFSEELYRIFELEQNGVVTVGRIVERVHPDDHPMVAAKMERARAGQSNPEYEIRLRMPDDRIKRLRVFGRLIRHEDGRLECLGAVQDVTQRRLAEEARDRMRSELAHVTRVMSLSALTASIAHEVNQPLAGIITNAGTCLRMLAADPPNIEGARDTARRTIRDGNRAGEVIARLRALFGKKAAVSETVDLNDATRGVLALLFSDILRNRVALRVELDDDPLLVTGDRVQLQQVILNLVRNAVEAMSEVNDRPRDMLVRVDREGEGGARLIVKDAGVGFEPRDAERLFDAFYTTKSDGMGIGLSLSRSIIESHGGKLWAEPNDGPGVTVAFLIPRLAESVVQDRTGGAVASSHDKSEAMRRG